MFAASFKHVCSGFIVALSCLFGSNQKAIARISDFYVINTAREIATQVNSNAQLNFWHTATHELKTRLVEFAGEEGARKFAKSKSWTAIDDGLSRGTIHGADQVYLGPDKTIHVIEAKGGFGRLSKGYGFPQGSTEWAVEAANKNILNPLASDTQRLAAASILHGAKHNKLEVHVIRTLHNFGKPSEPFVVQTTKCTEAASILAKNSIDVILKSIAQRAKPLIQASDDVARVTAGVSNAATNNSYFGKTVANYAVPLAVCVDGGIRIIEGLETEKRYSSGVITDQQREVEHTRNVAGMAGGWTGGWAGAKIGAWGGGAAGTAVVPGAGTTVGGILGGVAGGVAGYFGGEAVAAEAGEWVVTSIHDAGTTISECAEVAWDGTVYAASTASDGVVSTWNWIWGD